MSKRAFNLIFVVLLLIGCVVALPQTASDSLNNAHNERPLSTNARQSDANPYTAIAEEVDINGSLKKFAQHFAAEVSNAYVAISGQSTKDQSQSTTRLQKRQLANLFKGFANIFKKIGTSKIKVPKSTGSAVPSKSPSAFSKFWSRKKKPAATPKDSAAAPVLQRTNSKATPDGVTAPTIDKSPAADKLPGSADSTGNSVVAHRNTATADSASTDSPVDIEKKPEGGFLKKHGMGVALTGASLAPMLLPMVPGMGAGAAAKTATGVMGVNGMVDESGNPLPTDSNGNPLPADGSTAPVDQNGSPLPADGSSAPVDQNGNTLPADASAPPVDKNGNPPPTVENSRQVTQKSSVIADAKALQTQVYTNILSVLTPVISRSGGLVKRANSVISLEASATFGKNLKSLCRVRNFSSLTNPPA